MTDELQSYWDKQTMEHLKTTTIEKELEALCDKERMLKWFGFGKLSEPLKSEAAMFAGLAVRVVEEIEPGPERTVALRKLLESRDAAIRASVVPGG